jgi:hypothetical protein
MMIIVIEKCGCGLAGSVVKWETEVVGGDIRHGILDWQRLESLPHEL